MAATAVATADPRLTGSHSIVGWAIDLLGALGVPVTATNVQALVTWANHESGGYQPGNPVGLNNPLNTTQPQVAGAPGFDVIASGGAQGNIKGYGSYSGGIAAQAYNLLHTTGAGYENIIAALQQGTNPNAVFAAVDASRFGTKNLPTNATAATSIPAATTNGQVVNAGVQTAGWFPLQIPGIPFPVPVPSSPGQALNDAKNAVGGVTAAAGLAGQFIGLFSDWRFVVEVVGGLVLVLIGVRLIIADTTGRPVVPRPNTAQVAPLALAAAA